jgi:hypothetical protein
LNIIKTLEFQGQIYTLNQCNEELFNWIERSQIGDYTVYYDKVIFRTEKGVIAAYSNNLNNWWEI